MEDTSVALRLPDSQQRDAVVYRFPTARARRRAAVAARRRRVALAVCVAVVVATVSTVLGSSLTRPGSTTPPRANGSAPRAVVVEPGETLWDIARRYAPAQGDPRIYVDALAELNDLSGALQAGDRVRLPR